MNIHESGLGKITGRHCIAKCTISPGSASIGAFGDTAIRTYCDNVVVVGEVNIRNREAKLCRVTEFPCRGIVSLCLCRNTGKENKNDGKAVMPFL